MRQHRHVIADLTRNPGVRSRAAVILALRQYPQGGVPFVRIRIYRIRAMRCIGNSHGCADTWVNHKG